ncbi:drug metabolite transporter superfamily [Stylonychia lemnae]|uniref:Drug metabolite transporter superfamily n=1 Tax=Stylonychia lemnae TaxID=5949 RepID=A0A078A3N3_STYLE|nr:drug metabolite transporter superfamily [Stylonychia lemnae]|eukprot:CDW76863.1 drug metabolite transporter superfamily [Stylonychia lemnae]
MAEKQEMLIKADVEADQPTKVKVEADQPQEKGIIAGIKKLRGQIYMLFATLLSSAVFLQTKLLFKDSAITPYEINYWVGILLMIVQYFALRIKGVDIFYIPKECRTAIIIRTVLGYVSNGCMYAGLKTLSLSKVTLLFWTQPVFVGILGWYILGERFTKFDVLGILLVFNGVILIANPFEESVDYKQYPYETIGSIFTLFGAVTSAGAMISIRSLGGKVDSLLMTMYWAMGNALFSPLNLGIKIANEEMTTEYGWFEIFRVLCILISMFGYMQMQTLAYVSDKAVRVAPVATFVLILNCMADMIILGTKPSLMQIMGGILIISTNFGLSTLKCIGVI